MFFSSVGRYFHFLLCSQAKLDTDCMKFQQIFGIDNISVFLHKVFIMCPVAKQGHIVFALYVCWLDNFNIGHNL